MGLMNKIFGNTRKPQGFIGKMMARGMNTGSHAALAKWALADLPLKNDAQVLDVGCGGGGNVGRLLEKCSKGHVTGVDYSEVSVAQSTAYNKVAISQGRCNIVEGDVAKLPFSDGAFDCVTAFETVYFWPSIVDSFREVRRVLRPDGCFMIVNEADGKATTGVNWDAIIEGMHTYSAEELTTHLTAAGFTDIKNCGDAQSHRLKLIARR